MSNGRYRAYPEYKDSGLPWMTNVPTHWTERRFKHVLADKKKVLRPDLPAGSISFGRVVYKDAEVFSEETKASYQEVLSGEFLVNPLNLNYDLLSLRTALSSIDVVVSTGYIVLQCTGRMHSNYTRWLLQQFDVAHMKTLGAGVRQTINYADIGNSYFFEPPLPEQTQIAKFLDHETAKIDRLIEKQEALIRLLKEKRQAVISHAVTKGLNPHAPLKDSGIEWLGQVPAHWDLLKGSWLGRLFGSEVISDSDIRDEGVIPFIKVSTLSTDGFELGGCDFYVSKIRAQQLKPKSNYIVFPKRGAAIFTNKVNIVKRESVVDPNLMGWEIGPRAIPEFIAYLIKLRGLEDIADVSTVPQINNKHIEPIIFPIPPVDEQVQIIRHLEAETDNFGELMLNAEAAITLMQERRTALISAAVTGKIDVRHWQPPVVSKMETTEALRIAVPTSTE